ncbi:MAG: 6-phospho-3-hexuloisomerase [Candidatus Omnitrophota bacterium]
MKREYSELAPKVTAEISAVLQKVTPAEAEKLVAEILKAEKVFIFGVGRVFLALQCLGKRLGHLQIDCQAVGSVTEKPITKKDLLLVASGSGESKLPVQIARIAGEKGATIGLITSARKSTLKSIADFCVHLSAPTKTGSSASVSSIQPMSNLFEQALVVFGDIVTIMIQKKKELKNEDLWKRHANLE